MSNETKISINGMTCMHCVAAVEKALAAVDGVEEVIAVDLDSGTARVRGNAPDAALIAAVKEAGYEASI